MHEVTQYSKIWRYDYNPSKSGVMVSGKSRVQHYREKQANLMCCKELFSLVKT